MQPDEDVKALTKKLQDMVQKTATDMLARERSYVESQQDVMLQMGECLKDLSQENGRLREKLVVIKEMLRCFGVEHVPEGNRSAVTALQEIADVIG